jgi:hypothetical protein
LGGRGGERLDGDEKLGVMRTGKMGVALEMRTLVKSRTLMAREGAKQAP